MEPVVLETPRLRLHLVDLSNERDVAEILNVYNDPFTSALVTGINSAEDVRARGQKFAVSPSLCTKLPPGTTPPCPSNILVHLKTTGEHIGSVSMLHYKEMPCPDIGYAFFEQFNGQGYASEAAREVLRYWTETIGLKDILIVTTEDNVKSQALAKRIGFVEAGKLTAYWGDGQVDHRTVLMLPHMSWPEGGLVIHMKAG